MSLGISGAQAIGKAIPSKQERYNNQQLRELLERQGNGTLGLSGKERSTLTQQYMAPARTFTQQARTAQEAVTAGLGTTDARSLAQIRSAQQQALGQAATTAGGAIGAADLQRAQQQRTEIEQRLAAKKATGADRAAALGQLGADVATTAAEYPMAKKMWQMFDSPEGKDPWLHVSQQLAQRGYSREGIAAVTSAADRTGMPVSEILKAAAEGTGDAAVIAELQRMGVVIPDYPVSARNSIPDARSMMPSLYGPGY